MTLLRGWTITALSKDTMGIKLDMPDPLQVSSRDEPDLLFIQLELSEFKDQNGQSLQESLIKQTEMPR